MNMFRTMSHAMVVAAVVCVGNVSAMNFGTMAKNVNDSLANKDVKSFAHDLAVNTGASILKEEYDKGNPAAVAVVHGSILGIVAGLATGRKDVGVATGLAYAVAHGTTHVAPTVVPEAVAAPVGKVVPDCVKSDNAKEALKLSLALAAGYYAAQRATD